MEVFSLLKFWRNAGGGDPTVSGDVDSSFDDEESFFDLVFTNSVDENDDRWGASPTGDVIGGIDGERHRSNLGDPKSNFSFSSPSSANSKAPRSPFRVLMLGFQNNSKANLEKREMNCEIEEVKIGSLLKRDNSLRHKLTMEKLLEKDQMPSKRFSKEVVNKYLNLIKPSNMKVSRRCNEARSPGKPITPSSSPASSVFSPLKEEKRGGGRGAVFREVRKHLGKSRSASAILQTPATKRDDTVLQQQDGIQSAILHCKRSYNSPSQGCGVLSRSGSAPSTNQPRNSIDEEKRSSI